MKGNAKIPTVELSISEFNTLEYDYTFVKIWGKITERSDPYGTNAGANITIQDESGEQSIVRIWASTGVLHNDSFELVNESLDSLLQVESGPQTNIRTINTMLVSTSFKPMPKTWIISTPKNSKRTIHIKSRTLSGKEVKIKMP